MMRTLTGLLVVLALGLASAANALSIVVDTDKKGYASGESILVTTTTTISGAEPCGVPGTCALFLLELLWNDPQIDGVPGPANLGVPFTSGGGFFAWSQATGICLSASCLVIDQLSPIQPDGANADATVHVGTLTMIAGDKGNIKFSLGAAFLLGTAGTASLGGNAATAFVIPEPGTAALLGLGLAGLTLAGRRRR